MLLNTIEANIVQMFSTEATKANNLPTGNKNQSSQITKYTKNSKFKKCNDGKEFLIHSISQGYW